jgi:heme oxygenase (biliverdin-IX-beta and delta-forming)
LGIILPTIIETKKYPGAVRFFSYFSLNLQRLTTSDRLKTSTTSSHQNLEKSVLQLIQEIKTSADYGYLLGLFYSYFGGLELLLNASAVKNYVPDYDERRKAGLLKEDLLNLKISNPEICAKEDLPPIESPFQALGALYVMEGSTLGGVYIIKMIQKKLAGNENSLHFFSGYGDRNPLMWNRFKNALDQSTKNEDEMALIISGAEDTFHRFYEWINRN